MDSELCVLACGTVHGSGLAPPYSFAQNSISSLGVTTCEVGACSPMHDVMNSTFVALGGLTLVGAFFLHRHIRSGRSKRWILALAVVIAVSTAATGLFPANDGTIVHWAAVLPGSWRGTSCSP